MIGLGRFTASSIRMRLYMKSILNSGYASILPESHSALKEHKPFTSSHAAFLIQIRIVKAIRYIMQ